MQHFQKDIKGVKSFKGIILLLPITIVLLYDIISYRVRKYSIFFIIRYATDNEMINVKSDNKCFATSAVEAEKSLLVSPATCAILSRRAVELAVKWVYSFKNRN